MQGTHLSAHGTHHCVLHVLTTVLTIECALDRDLSAHPLLQALADRELPVRRGMLATIVFLRCENARGQARRLQGKDFATVSRRHRTDAYRFTCWMLSVPPFMRGCTHQLPLGELRLPTGDERIH